jgi:transcriptional regulator with XRE-family HTH domain
MKRTFTIGQAAGAVGVSPSAIRLWEKQGLVRSSRTLAGHRRFTADDIRQLRHVRELHEVRRGPIHQLRDRLSLRDDWEAPGPETGEDNAPVGIGPRLRRARLAREMSLRELAGKAGVSATYVSAIERGFGAPSIAVLQKLTAALGLTVATLVEPSPPASTMVRAGEANLLEIGVTGVKIENLAPAAGRLESQLFTTAPGAGSGGIYRHEGEEFLYVLEGVLEIWLDRNEHHVVGAGDSLCFASGRAHRWRNSGEQTARILWINTPPTF